MKTEHKITCLFHRKKDNQKETFRACSEGSLPVRVLDRVLHRADHLVALEHPHHRQRLLGLQIPECQLRQLKPNTDDRVTKGMEICQSILLRHAIAEMSGVAANA
jgi:hypothetical protein